MHVGESPFDKYARLQLAAYWNRNSTTNTFPQKGKGVLKFQKFQKDLCAKLSLFSLTLQVCSPEFLTLTKSDSKENASCGCSLKYFKARIISINEILIPQIKVSRPKREIKFPQKRTFKNSSVEKQCYKKAFLMFRYPATFLEFR